VITIRPGHVVAGVFLAVTLARGPASCQAPPTGPTIPAGPVNQPPVAAVVHDAGKCPMGWVCTPGTNRCDPSYRCGTCPNNNHTDSWSYLDDGSAMAREAQTDPKLNWILNTSKPCG
jgi:hypothetical protein